MNDILRDLFIIWIIIQLVLLGEAVATIHNEIIDGTYICHPSEKISKPMMALFPLVLFMPEKGEITEYCSSK